jgi:hypothetical protein
MRTFDSSYDYKLRSCAQMTNKPEYVNVRLEKSVHERLRLQGACGDSLSDVVRGLLNEREKKRQKTKGVTA